jgi:hypothetical protein
MKGREKSANLGSIVLRMMLEWKVKSTVPFLSSSNSAT